MDVQQFVWVPYAAVGASLLAKVVNDDAGRLVPRVALRFLASELAPTGQRYQLFSISTCRVSLRQNNPTIRLTPVTTTGYHNP